MTYVIVYHKVLKYATMPKGLLTQSKTCNKMAEDVIYRSATYSEMAHGVMYQKVKVLQELHTIGNISLLTFYIKLVMLMFSTNYAQH